MKILLLAAILFSCTGPMGPMGPKGTTGAKGEKGYRGNDGDRGIRGYTVHVGRTGFTGKDGRDGRDGKDASVPKKYNNKHVCVDKFICYANSQKTCSDSLDSCKEVGCFCSEESYCFSVSDKIGYRRVCRSEKSACIRLNTRHKNAITECQEISFSDYQ